MPADEKIKVAVLDDYQGVALQMADWSGLKERTKVTVFTDHVSDAATLVERLKPFAVICVMRERTPLPRAILDQLPHLKLIASTGARNSSIDLAAAAERGITVCSTGSLPHGVTELTWALILGIVRNVTAEDAAMRKGLWQISVGGDLKGKTLGIVGLGRVGAAVAKIAHAFGLNLIAWSPNLTEEKAAQCGARLVSKEQLFRDADIVTVHLVLSARSKGVVGAAELAWMKPTAYLVNTSRGPLVDESALVNVLRKRKIAGAALDVYDTEPLPEMHPFHELDNVLITPHIGFVTRDTYQVFFRETVENISAWLDGKPIRVMTP